MEETNTEARQDVESHCAVQMAVDMAECDDKVEEVRAINAGGIRDIAYFYKKTNCKYNFLCEIFRQAGYTTKVISVTAEEYRLSKVARTFNISSISAN